MDQQAVAVATVEAVDTVGRWGLDPAVARDLQGLVVSPFAHLRSSVALFIELPPACGGAWLQALLDLGLITDATAKVDPSGAIALTYSGLERMGLPPDVLATFPAPFREGMTDPDRARRLGDWRTGPLPPALAWSGNVAWDHRNGTPFETPPTRSRDTVHAILLLYAGTGPALDALSAQARAALLQHGVLRADALPLTLQVGGGSHEQPPREHFGFADGFSQPMPHLDPAARDRLHGVPVGEVVIGYDNAHGEKAVAPSVGRETLAGQPSAAGLADLDSAAGQASLGLNGTFMTVRQLHQDVAAFRASLQRTAAALGDPAIDADWLAERVIGRSKEGDLLVPGGTLPAVGGAPDNNFAFFAKDRYGHGCPIGAHVRRMNPRDGLAKDESARASTLKAANNHRIMRRARKYGDVLAEGVPDDGAPRGLLFMCLHTDIARQFEFVQQTWLMNPMFGTLVDETDPLVGPAGPFTIPADPFRRRLHVETFVSLVGGEYFFLPSVAVLAYLGARP